MKHLVLTVLLLALAVPSSAQEVKIFTQEDAPLRITEYKAEFQRRSDYRTEGIKHEVRYENASGRTIVASQIGLVSFNVFNQFLDRTNGIDMDELAAGKSARGTWVASSYADFSFYTGVAYISRVRFSNGEVWEADFEAVTEYLQVIEEDFEAARLTGDEAGGG